jgi:hypothetical protein
LRVNLSGSGIGMSTGISGLRVGAGPRGTYVRMGRGGVHYQQTRPRSAPSRTGGSRGPTPGGQPLQGSDVALADMNPVAIERIVWFTHLRARSGTCTSPTVRIVFSPGQVPGLLRRSPANLSDSHRPTWNG